MIVKPPLTGVVDDKRPSLTRHYRPARIEVCRLLIGAAQFRSGARIGVVGRVNIGGRPMRLLTHIFEHQHVSLTDLQRVGGKSSFVH